MTDVYYHSSDLKSKHTGGGEYACYIFENDF